MSIGDHLRSIRVKRGLTQKELGEKSGIDPSNISKYENGKQSLRTDTLNRLAQVLEINPGTILGPDYFSQTHAALEERLRKDGVFEKYLESIGYSVTYEKVGESESGDYEEQVLNGEVVDRIWIPDEEYFNTIIGKAGVETEFTEEEFKAFQAEIEQSIEYQLWKKNQSR